MEINLLLKLIDNTIEKYQNSMTDEPSTTNHYCNNIKSDLKKMRNTLILLKSLEELENKYRKTEISMDVLKILEEVRLKDIDFDEVKGLLDAR